MKKSKQYSFFKAEPKFYPKFFGGALLNGKRKSFRPLSSKDAIHFVLRSQWAFGKDSFLVPRNKKAIEGIIKRFAKKFGVRIYQQAITSNHLHLLLKITNRYLYQSFIKAFSGIIASHVMGQQSFQLFTKSRSISVAGGGVTTETQGGNKNTNKPQGFWQFRPFSRVVHWGRDFQKCTGYLKQNILEALGFIPYTVRKNYYTKWLKETVPDLNPKAKPISTA